MTVLKSQEPYHLNSQEIIAKYGIEEKLSGYLQAIMDYNRKVNLVSRETSSEQLFRIAADCLVPFEFLDPPSGRIFDIGSGAGFPGVVLLFAFPQAKATLIERRVKKAVFLDKIVRQFDLNAEVIDSDLKETIPSLELSSFDYGFMKLVRLDRKILALACSLLKPTGKFIYYSSFDKNDEGRSDSLTSNSFDYYLDDVKQLRTITVFSK